MVLHMFSRSMFNVRSIIKITKFLYIVIQILDFAIFTASNILFSNFSLKNSSILAPLFENC